MSLPESIRNTAAAGIATCSLAGYGTSARAQINWDSGPNGINGVYPTVAGDGFLAPSTTDIGVDFDDDGVIDFVFYYYAGFFQFDTERSIYLDLALDPAIMPLNPDADVLFTDANISTHQGKEVWFPKVESYSDLDDLYVDATAFTPPPRDGSVDSVSAINPRDFDDQRVFVGGVFTGGDGNRYLGYIDLEISPDSTAFSPQPISLSGDGSITIFGSGFTLINGSGLPADFDGDGDVDGVDIAEMFSNFNGPAGGVPVNPDTDLDGDGDVDGVDIAQIFGMFTGPLTTTNVPEPSSILLIGLGAAGVVRRRH